MIGLLDGLGSPSYGNTEGAIHPPAAINPFIESSPAIAIIGRRDVWRAFCCARWRVFAALRVAIFNSNRIKITSRVAARPKTRDCYTALG